MVQFFHINVPKSLANALLNPVPAAPFAQLGDAQLVAIQKLSTVLYAALVKPQASPVAAPRVPLTATARSPKPCRTFEGDVITIQYDPLNTTTPTWTTPC